MALWSIFLAMIFIPVAIHGTTIPSVYPTASPNVSHQSEDDSPYGFLRFYQTKCQKLHTYDRLMLIIIIGGSLLLLFCVSLYCFHRHMKKKWNMDDEKDDGFTEIEIMSHTDSHNVKLEGNGDTQTKTFDVTSKKSNLDDWTSLDVYDWLSSADNGTFKNLAQEFKNEDIKGPVMKNMTLPQLQSRFSVLLGDALEFEDLRKELIENVEKLKQNDGESENKTKPMNKVDECDGYKYKDLNDWNVNDVFVWLSSIDDGHLKNMAIKLKDAQVDGKMLKNITESDDLFGSDIDFGDKLQFIDYRDELLTKMNAVIGNELQAPNKDKDKDKKELNLKMDVPEYSKEDSTMLTPKISPMISPIASPVIGTDITNEMSEVELDEIGYNEKQIEEWNVNDVYQWLCSNDLRDVAVQFEKAKIRGLILKDITTQQLEEESAFDIPFGDKLMLIRLRNELVSGQSNDTEMIEVKTDVFETKSQKNEEEDALQPIANKQLNDLRKWFVEELVLPQYFDLFVDAGFDDLDSLQDITKEDLIEIGIEKLGHRKKILRKANKF